MTNFVIKKLGLIHKKCTFIIEIPKHLVGIFLKIIVTLYLTLITIIIHKKINFLNLSKIWKKIFISHKINLKGIENIPNKNGYVVISNHVSFEDPLILGEIFDNIHFVAANGKLAKIFYNDYPRLILYDIHKNIVKAGIIVKQKILENVMNKKNVAIFPEAQFCLPNKLNPFKKGLFYLCWDNNIPLVPVILLIKKNTKFVFTLTYNSNKINVEILKTILPSQFNNFEDFYNYSYNLMNTRYKYYIDTKKGYDIYL